LWSPCTGLSVGKQSILQVFPVTSHADSNSRDGEGSQNLRGRKRFFAAFVAVIAATLISVLVVVVVVSVVVAVCICGVACWVRSGFKILVPAQMNAIAAIDPI
jgi:hypothetical protein